MQTDHTEGSICHGNVNVLTARANGDTLRNGQGADITPAQARRELKKLGYVRVPDSA